MRDILPAAHLLSDGPVRYLLVAGERDDGLWGSIGAFWRAIEGGNPSNNYPHTVGVTSGIIDAKTATVDIPRAMTGPEGRQTPLHAQARLGNPSNNYPHTVGGTSGIIDAKTATVDIPCAMTGPEKITYF